MYAYPAFAPFLPLFSQAPSVKTMTKPSGSTLNPLLSVTTASDEDARGRFAGGWPSKNMDAIFMYSSVTASGYASLAENGI